MTLSPTAMSRGTRLPLSSMRPGPTATTSPSWGFSFAVSGMTRPDAVVCSASRGLTTMRSSRGLMLTDTVSTSAFSHVVWVCTAALCRASDAAPGPRRRGGRGPITTVGTLVARVPDQTLALPMSECQHSPCEDGAVDLDTFTWLLGDDGQRLLERATHAYADADGDPLRASAA